MPTFYVDGVAGDDFNGGTTEGAPLQSVAQAFFNASQACPTATEDVEVRLKGGQVHDMPNYTLFVSELLNRPDDHWLRFANYGTGRPALAGREAITGWSVSNFNPRVATATYAGRTRNVWMDNYRLRRATFGETPDFDRFFRLYSEGPSLSYPNGRPAWDEVNQTVRISSFLTPVGLSTWVGLEMTIHMGWALSHLPVQDIVIDPNDNGLAIVSFDPAAAAAEFAKGDVTAPGGGTQFTLGPFHQNPVSAAQGQRFWWSNKINFMQRAGDWYHDRATNTLYLWMPNEISDVAALEAEGVYVPTMDSAFLISGEYNLDVPNKARNLAIEGIDFKNFGYIPPTDNEGYIGYITGASLYDNGGSLEFRTIPGAITINMAENVRINDCSGTDLSQLFIRCGMGVKNLTVDDYAIARTSSGGILCAGVPFGSFNATEVEFHTAPEASWNQNFRFNNGLLTEIGNDYLGTALFAGAANGMEITRHTVINVNGNGIDAGNGSRWYGTWVEDIEIRGNHVENTHRWSGDGGAIYVNGNISGFLSVQNEVLNFSFKPAVITENLIKNIYPSGFDPLGGNVGGTYCDLGSHNNGIFVNHMEDVQIACKLNCTTHITFEYNKVINPDADWRQFYSGINVFLFGTNTSERVDAPLSSPPSAADIDAFYNRRDVIDPNTQEIISRVAPFNLYYGFPTPESVINRVEDGVLIYNTLARIENNGPDLAWTLGPTGATDELLAKWGHLIE